VVYGQGVGVRKTPSVFQKIRKELAAYGALPSQLVDIDGEESWRQLSYLDLRAESPGWRRPVVVENNGRPCVHVFDAHEGATPEDVARWCWRIALRGDGAWIGVLEPGRLRVFRADVNRDKVQPHEVASAARGEWALPKFLNDVSAGRDDLARRRYLTKLLDGSAREATDLGLTHTDALSLVGRGLFWRFLYDRNLLTGLEPSDVCDDARTWEECLDTKARALRTFQWLDETFNGGLLPFEHKKPRDFAPGLFSSVLGNIVHGATETGQLRLPTDWREVNFSYVPVGLLSEVYEAFAHHIDPEEADRLSIHYTPSHLVDFIVTQALEQLPRGGKPRVLDPAAGAGVFLVTAFRKLVEKEWKETGARPRRRRIREILNRQLVGFDRDTRALRLAELALYLTALELDPKPRPLNELTFDALRGTVLVDVSQNPHGSLGPVEERFRGQFDLVVGNPPWRAVDKEGQAAKKAWSANTKRVLQERLGAERAAAFDLPDTNTDIPFVWRAMEWAKKGGRIVLVTHARWLFGISDPATRARNDLLQAVRVTGILNGTALRRTNVWPSVEAPWCVLFATNELPLPFDRAAFQFVSPAVDASPDVLQGRVRIDWLDAQTVLTSEVVENPWALKARFRGNPIARRALEAMTMGGEELGAYLSRLGTALRNGYQVGAKAGKQDDARHMKGWPSLKGAGPLGFVVEARALPKFDRTTLLRPRKPWIYAPPLLLLRKAIPVNLLEARAHLANDRVAFHESFHGASFAEVDGGSEIAAYLQLVLQSAAFTFFAILTDAQFGVFVDAIHLESAMKMPVVAFEKLSESQRRSARELASQLADGLDEDLAARIDTLVLGTFALTDVEREAVHDTLETALPSSDSKRRAVASPGASERRGFIEALQASLESVLAAVEVHATVEERDDLRWSPWRVLEVTMSRDGRSEESVPPMKMFLEEADANGASMVSVRASDATWFVGLLERYVQWTPTRARLLASNLIAERSS
jgi:N-6 DNA Methylase